MAMAKDVNEKNEAAKNAEGKAGSGMAGTAAANVGKKPDISAGGRTRADKTAGKDAPSGGAREMGPVYTAEEFCSCAQKLFQARPECVRAALAESKVTQCTKAEAHRIVDAFLHKEVK